jgi:peroxiredoxin Q/BCP
MYRLIFVVVLILLAVIIIPRIISASPPPAVGTTAPDFTLSSQEGKPVSLKDFRGKWVVLYFYPKDFTSGCTVEAHNFQRDQAKFEERHAMVLGISVDSASSHKEFCTKEGLSFKLLADTEHKVSKEYGSLTNLGLVKFSTRNTFVIDPAGKVTKVFTGVKPNQHSEEVLAALDQAQKK